MKRRMLFLMIMLFWLLPAAVPCFAEEVRTGEWNEVSELDGIVGYTRWTSLTSVDEVMAVGTVDAPVAVIEAVLRDIPAQPEYMFRCVEAVVVDVPGMENRTDAFCAYNRTGMPWPVDDRYGIARAEYLIDHQTGTLHIRAREIEGDFDVPVQNAVRMPLTRMKIVIVPLESGGCKMTYQVLADPGGSLPSFVVNLFTKNLGIKTIAGIREMVKREKYRGAPSVVTTTPYEPADFEPTQ